MHFMDIARRNEHGTTHVADSIRPPGRIVWQSVITVLSAAVLISAEVFGAAFAGGWALANLMGLGDYGILRQLLHALHVILFFVLGVCRDGRLRPQRACGSSRSARGAWMRQRCYGATR